MAEVSRITIPGRPITKKNSQKIVKYGNRRGISQSDAYQRYEEASLWWLKRYKEKYNGKISVCAKYWMPNRRSWPDLIGLLQATSDILEKSGIIENDKWIEDYDGSRIMGIDKENPRVEITIQKVS